MQEIDKEPSKEKETEFDEQQELRLKKQRMDMFLYKNYVDPRIYKYAIKDQLTHANMASFWNAETRGLLFKIWLFKLHHYREKYFSVRYFNRNKVRYLNQEKSIFERDDQHVVTFKDRFYSEYIQNFSSRSVKRGKFCKMAINQKRPDISFSQEFWEKINRNRNEAHVDIVYRGIEDVLRGDLANLQLLKLDDSFGDLKEIFNEKDGNFLGVLKVEGGESKSDYFLPVELTLDYYKNNLFMNFFIPNSKGVKNLQRMQIEDDDLNFPFGMNFNFLNICNSYDEALKILRTPPGGNRWSKAYLAALKLNQKLKNSYFESYSLGQQYKKNQDQIRNSMNNFKKNLEASLSTLREKIEWEKKLKLLEMEKKKKEEKNKKKNPGLEHRRKLTRKEMRKKKKEDREKLEKELKAKERERLREEREKRRVLERQRRDAQRSSKIGMTAKEKIAENKRVQRERKLKYKNKKKEFDEKKPYRPSKNIEKIREIEEKLEKDWSKYDPAALEYGDIENNLKLEHASDEEEEASAIIIEDEEVEEKKFCAYNEFEKKFEFFFYKLTSPKKFQPSFDLNAIYTFDIGYFQINLLKMNPIHFESNFNLKQFLLKEFIQKLKEMKQDDFTKKTGKLKVRINEIKINISQRKVNLKKEMDEWKKTTSLEYDLQKCIDEDIQIQEYEYDIKYYEKQIDWLDNYRIKEWYWNKYFDDEGKIAENIDELVDLHSYEFQFMTKNALWRAKRRYKTWPCFGWDKKFKLYSKAVYNKETKKFDFSEFSVKKRGINEIENGYPISGAQDYICYPCIDITGVWEELDVENTTIPYYDEELKRISEMKYKRMLKRNELEEERKKDEKYAKRMERREMRRFKKAYGKKVEKMKRRLFKNLGKRNIHHSLKNIPGFNFRFTEDQLTMINRCPKRMIIIGRSGTGKSTCAILKMLAIDLLFITRKCLIQGKTKVNSFDLKPTGIKHLFLTASRVLADDLKVFYNVLIENLREKLLGKELKKEANVKKILDTVKEMEKNPIEFADKLVNKKFKEDEEQEKKEDEEKEKKEEVEEKKDEEFADLLSNDSEKGSDLSDFAVKDLDSEETEESEIEEEKPEEKEEKKEEDKKEEGDDEEMKEGGEENEEMHENDPDAKISEDESEEDDLDKSFEFEDDGTTKDSEKLDNAFISNMKKQTLAEIEEKLKSYNFRFDSFKKGTNYEQYPIFTTLVDYYQNTHMNLNRSGFLKQYRFKLTEEKRKTLKKVSFNEYLDNYSNRRFNDINNKILQHGTDRINYYKETKLFEEASTHYSRLVDARAFETEFFPFLDMVYKYLKKKQRTWKHLPVAIKNGRPMPFELKKGQKLDVDPREFGEVETQLIYLHKVDAYEKMQEYKYVEGTKTSNKQKKVEILKFPKKYSKFPAYSKYRKVHTPAFIWNLMKNRESDESIFEQGEYALQFILSVFDFWKRKNHCYELRDLAILGGHSSKKTYWYWYYNWDGTRSKRIAFNPYKEIKTYHGFGSQKFSMDFVYLDEIQDVSLKVILDLELIAGSGFVGFGDNAQNITKGVSMKFEELVEHMDNIDTLEEVKFMSRRSAKAYRVLRDKRELRNRRRMDGRGTKKDDRDSDHEKHKNFFDDEIIHKNGKDFRVQRYRKNQAYREIYIPRPKNCVFVKLRKNFRSHKKILDLGNSIVRILEMLQRGDLDIMDDEISDMDGPKPMVFKRGQKVSDLVNLLQKGYGATMTKEGRVRSSAEQVILVRDQEEKRNLPEVLKDMIVFTIKESKGLEFEHVILYNFFATSVHYQCWNYLKNAEIQVLTYSQSQYDHIMHQKSLSKSGLVDNIRYFKAKLVDGSYIMPSMVMDKTINTKNQELYNYINDELKALYVAITRAKGTFVVFDGGSAAKSRINMDNIWKTLNVVDFIDKTYVEKNLNNQFCISKEKQISQFKTKGFEFLRREQFEHALKCFENLNHENAIDLCQGFILLEKIQKKEYYINMNQNVSTIDVEAQLKDDYNKVAQIFVKAKKYRDAALCFFNGMDYIKARQFFEKSEMKKEAAQMNYLLGHYLKASDLFYEIGDYYSCLICREMKGNPSDFLEILVKMFQKNKEEKVKNEEKFIKLFERYMKRFLENLNNEMYMELAEMRIQEELRKKEIAKEKEEERKAIKEEKIAVNQEIDDDLASVSGLGSFVEVNSRAPTLTGDGDSFVNLNSRVSDMDSFRILKESSEGRDSLAESFVNVTFDEDGKAQSVGDSAFLNIGFEPGDAKVFLEERVFSKILKFGSCFIDLVESSAERYKYKENVGKEKQNELIEVDEDSENEFDVDELTTANVNQTLIDALITYFIEWNLDELHWMFINKFKSKKNYRRMVFKLSEDYSIVGTSAISFSFKSFYNPRHYLSRSDQKRLTTMAFSSIFQRIPKNMLKIGDADDPNAILSSRDVNILVMLGFMRQILFLLPYEDNKNLLTFLGDIDVLGIVWCKKELKTQQEKDSFISRAVNANIFQKIKLICTEYYDIDLLEAALFKMFKYSFWDSFDQTRLGEILEFSNDPNIIEKLPFLTNSIKLLVEYQKAVNLTVGKEDDRRLMLVQIDRLNEISRMIKALLADCLDREKLESEYLEKYEVGIVFSIWYCFFNLKTPPNCPFDFGKKERKKLPLFSEKDDQLKEGMLNQSRKLKRSLYVIYEKYCLDFQRFIKKNETHDPSKNGFWSVFLVREVEPMKTKFFRGLGIQKYYVVHKLSQIAILTKELDPKEVMFVENTLELLAIQTTAFEKKVASYLKLKEEKKLMVEASKGLRTHPSGVNANFMRKCKKIVEFRKKEGHDNPMLFERLRYKVKIFPEEWKEYFKKRSFYTDRIVRMTYIMKHEIDPELGYNTDGKKQEIELVKRQLRDLKRKAIKACEFHNFSDYSQIMRDSDVSLLSFEQLPYHNMYMMELINDFSRRNDYLPEHVIDMFLICRRLGKMPYYSMYYRKCKNEIRKNSGKTTEDRKDLIFALMDAEFSLQAGCSNEFIDTTIWILTNYHNDMRWRTFYNMLLRLLAVYNMSFEGQNKGRLYEFQVEYIEDFEKGGEILKDGNSGLTQEKPLKINESRLDVLKHPDSVTQDISNLLAKQVLSKEYSIDRSEELAYLMILQLRSDSCVSKTTRKILEENYDDMTYNLYHRINHIGDTADDEILLKSEEEEEKWISQYADELRNPIYKAGNDLQFPVYLEVENKGNNSESNLEAYNFKRTEYLKEIVEHEISLQIFRKYKTELKKYLKFETKQQLSKQREVKTKIPSTLLSRTKEIYDLLEKKAGSGENYNSYYNSMLELLKGSLSSANSTTERFLKFYTNSNLLRNFVYVIDHYLTLINTIQELLEVIDYIMDVKDKESFGKYSEIIRCQAKDFRNLFTRTKVVNINNAFKLKNKNTDFYENFNRKSDQERQQVMFEYNQQKEIFQNMVRSYSTTKTMIKAFKKKYFRPTLEKRFNKFANKGRSVYNQRQKKKKYY